VCLIASSAAYFLGSKSFMLFPFVLAAFYYEHAVRPIPRFAVLVGALALASGVFALQLLQGTAATIVDTIAYFEYFVNTAHFMEDFNGRFHFTYGGTWLSTLWQFVPRAIYPDKPFIFGQAVIMEDYNPGAGELGATPGILPWAASYLDFGSVGVVIDGLLTGMVAKGAFALLRLRPGFVAILIFGQIGLITNAFAQPFYGAPFLIFWLWLVGELWILGAAAEFRTAWYHRLQTAYANHI
jgi:hypothetical protein